jgi:hypothetical protein
MLDSQVFAMASRDNKHGINTIKAFRNADSSDQSVATVIEGPVDFLSRIIKIV